MEEKKEKKTKLCLLRDIFRSIREYEMWFQEKHDLCLNEGMAICSLSEGRLSSSDLADKLGLSASNMSKVIKSIEEKELVTRILGEEDKRQMYFLLSKAGENKLQQMQKDECTIDEILSSIYATEGTAVKFP